MKLKELAEMIIRFNEKEGLSQNALSCLKNFAVDALKAHETTTPGMNNYRVYTITDTENHFEFTGKYRRDLETENWHYYEKENGEICHFRKEHMVAVFGDTAESIKAAKEG